MPLAECGRRSSRATSSGVPSDSANGRALADGWDMAVGAPIAAEAARTVRLPGPVASCLKAAQEAIAARRWSDAIERLAAMAVVDIQQHRQTFLAGAREAGMVGDSYASCFEGAGLERRHFAVSGGVRRRVVYVMPSIAEGQAASRRLVQMVRRHDRGRLEVRVVVTEEFTCRVPATTFLKWPQNPSVQIGASLISELRSIGVDPLIMPASGSYLDGARATIEQVRALGADVAVFVASPACPISAAMAWARVAPVQVNQNVAVPLVIDGINGVIYHNSACAMEDAPELARRGICVIPVAGNGTDLDAADRAMGGDRATLGVPQEATVLVSAGNRLAARAMAGTFAEDLARFMSEHSNVWWLAVGPGDFGPVLERLGGARSRVVLAGPQADIRGWLKAADVYVNEYPEGGANTVLESMACGVPVVAMRAGVRHTESIGAELVGDAVIDAGAYWARVAEWCADPAARKENASAQGGRVRERFGYEAICRAYERCYESLCA